MRPAIVARHAAQLDEELPERAAGSQQEAAAATYILGHLELAGYAVRLDSVPVEDLVRSTNLVALPPSGTAPEAVVAVAYGDPVGNAGNGADVGLFLELARALRVARPGHPVEFAALGAQSPGTGGRDLGARRLVRLLADSGADTVILSILGAGEGDAVCSAGGVPAVLDRGGGGLSVPECGAAGAQADPFAGAPVAHATIRGPVGALGRVLLRRLSSLGD